jgi:hypothetical protein
MARFRVYLTPFTSTGVYDTEIEVTKDVASISDPKQTIDSTDFDVGVIKNSGLNIVLRNHHGHYSDVGNINSIFKSTRKNSKIRITWDIRDYDMICGFFTCGDEPLGGEYEIFRGLLNEVSSTSDIALQQATFACLGYESVLDEIEIPYSDLSNGDLFSVVLNDCLDQSPFNTLTSVSVSNITPGTDLAIDDKSSLENKTVGAVLKNLLLAANSVLFLKNNTVYVTDRTASDATEFTFYGQAAISGIENIINIPKYRDGMNRVFNQWTWSDTTVVARDTTSQDDYGVRAKEIKLDVIADASTAKIQTILNANRTEFSFPKIELDLETPIWYDTLALNILDRVSIDYPTVNIPADSAPIPRYGQVEYDGTARYPYEQWALTIDSTTSFKIMNKKINVKKQTITFGLREV